MTDHYQEAHQRWKRHFLFAGRTDEAADKLAHCYAAASVSKAAERDEEARRRAEQAITAAGLVRTRARLIAALAPGVVMGSVMQVPSRA